MKKTFETFLQDKHATQYEGLDDEMPDDFNEWLCNLDPDQWIILGDLWGLERAKMAVDKLEKAIMGGEKWATST